IVSLDGNHILKRWITKASNPQKKNLKEFENINRILTTKFNLITDIKEKREIADFLKKITGDSVLERILRSYLYLILGNVTESNKQLKSIYTSNPNHLYIDDLDLNSHYMQ